MSIAPPRYAAAPVPRVGRSGRTWAIFVRELGACAGWGTYLVVAFAYLTTLAVLLLSVELAPPGAVSLATFYQPLSGDLWPLEILLVAAVVGSGSIAEDLGSRSITMYLSRPIHLEDYLTGKAAGVAFWVALVAFGPGVVGCIVAATLGGASATLALSALVRFLLVGLLATFFFASLALALSAWAGRALYAGVAVLGLVLALQISISVIAGITGNPQVPYLAPITDLRSVGQGLFLYQPATATEPVVSAVLLGAAAFGLLLATWSRLVRVEVVGE